MPELKVTKLLTLQMPGVNANTERIFLLWDPLCVCVCVRVRVCVWACPGKLHIKTEFWTKGPIKWTSSPGVGAHQVPRKNNKGILCMN